MRIVFLTGAGVSFDLLPLSKMLDQVIRTGLTGDGREAARLSDATYGLIPGSSTDGIGRQHVYRVTKFLEWLTLRLPDPAWDYERLAFACRQLDDVVTGEMENPLLQPLVSEVERQARAIPRPLAGGGSVMELCRETLNYISGIVSEALADRSGIDEQALQGALPSLVDAGRDPDVDRLDLVTLNHDTLQERCLQGAGILAEDGFGRPASGWTDGRQPATVRLWRGYRRKRRRVRLVKLHGSVDWWRIRPTDGSWSDDIVAQLNGNPYRLRDVRGVTWSSPESVPEILVGTFNKILDYTRPFHLQRYAVMRRAFLMSDALIIAGYSFRDKAVNGMITDWYYRTRRGSVKVPPRPLVVIGPRLSPGAPPETARGAIANKWLRWVEDRRLTVLSARFSDVDWSSVKALASAH